MRIDSATAVRSYSFASTLLALAGCCFGLGRRSDFYQNVATLDRQFVRAAVLAGTAVLILCLLAVVALLIVCLPTVAHLVVN